MMNIRLEIDPFIATELVRDFADPEFDDFRTVIYCVCESLERKVRLITSGFGDDSWRIINCGDVGLILEEIPFVLADIRNSSTTRISYNALNMNRYIDLLPVREGYRATCISLNKFIPNPAFYDLKTEVLIEMLEQIMSVFMSALDTIPLLPFEKVWIDQWKIGGWPITSEACMDDAPNQASPR
jgi:hypothetical protein